MVGKWVRAYREERGETEEPLTPPGRARLRELERPNREPSGGGRLAFAGLCLAVVVGLLIFGSGRVSGRMPAIARKSAATAGVLRAAAGSPAAIPRDPLRPVAAYLADRLGTVNVAVYDPATHQTWTAGDTGRAQYEASIAKVDILETLLAPQPAGLTSAQAELAEQMIEVSDNDAATVLWDAEGGAAGLRAFGKLAGLTRTTPSACCWGLTTTTPLDQLKLLRELISTRSVLNAAARRFALRLMENVTPDQRWGVSGGVPPEATVALKDGWLPLDAAHTDWQINSIGWVSGLGRDYLIAVLSTGNPSETYGIDTIDELSAILWRQLAGTRHS